jgi:hypothetical protein
VFLIAGKIGFQFAPKVSREETEEHLHKAGEAFLKADDPVGRAEAFFFQGCCLRLEGDSDWIMPFDFVADALSQISSRRYEPLFTKVVIEVGHAYCDSGEIRKAEDTLGALKQLPMPADYTVRLSRAWFEARVAKAQGDHESALSLISESLQLVERIACDYRALLERDRDAAAGLA